VLHRDFHGGNVLRAKREPWLVTDPKPLVGERGFSSRNVETDIIESSRILVASA
jgi:streptomycin 6-kinase